MWTGLMLKISKLDFENKIDKNSKFFSLSRLDNNNAESYFSHLKTRLLQLNERKLKNKLLLSQISIPIKEDIESKYIEYGYSSIFSQNNEPKIKSSENIKEVWKDKNEKYFRVKGFYYKNNLKYSISTQTNDQG